MSPLPPAPATPSALPLHTSAAFNSWPGQNNPSRGLGGEQRAGDGWVPGSQVPQELLGSERTAHSLPCELSMVQGQQGALWPAQLGPCPHCSHCVPVWPLGHFLPFTLRQQGLLPVMAVAVTWLEALLPATWPKPRAPTGCSSWTSLGWY